MRSERTLARSTLGASQEKTPNFRKPLFVMADPTAVALFKELGAEYEIDPTVITWLTPPGGWAAKKLDGLLYACDENGIDKLVEAAKPSNLILSATPGLRCKIPVFSDPDPGKS